MDKKSFVKLELNKILVSAAGHASLDGGKKAVMELLPSADIAEVRRRLAFTRECNKLMYVYGVGKICQFGNLGDILPRAGKGSILSCAELITVAGLLRSVREAYLSISKINDGEIVLTKAVADGLYYDVGLETDISDKILNDETVSDRASEKLFSIRNKIKSLNERIREKLSEYISGKNAEYLQDSIVTIRNDRYVIPVKAEHKNHIKGFIHDRSKTGATFFIEPEYVLELNNELVALTIDEKEEVEAILKALSARVGALAVELGEDIKKLSELDLGYALAEFGYSLKCTEPKVNNRGYIDIIKGRHPLIERNKAVPVSLELGSAYNFLLLSGANTGGKTVTLKMCGLFCLMAACGMFIPAAEGSSVAVFDDVFCDVGDSQSIEESLSTFSSHIENIIEICDRVHKNCLVLIDELGGGTNPDEGQAIAKAVVKKLLETGCKGIVTTHFTPLKEFAYTVDGIENASMEFDSTTLKPLYSIKIGLPGASNALAIARRLGMDGEILENAVKYLSEGGRNFENIVRRAEESRVQADKKLAEAESLKKEWQDKLEEVNRLADSLNREREKIARTARSESRRIINERTEKAEQLLGEIEEIFKKQTVSESDLIRARTLKNKLENSAYDEEPGQKQVNDFKPATAENIKAGVRVYIKPMDAMGEVIAFNSSKGEAEVLCGSIKIHLKLKDLQVTGETRKEAPKPAVKVVKNIPRSQPVLEINVLGLTVGEALYEVDNFIDRAVTDNLSEIKIIHGVGTGKLKTAIWEHLKKHKNVAEYRLGKYGEGETGVTFVKLK